jgi:transposase
MRFYNRTHQYYCGIDLHAKQMYTCIIDHNGDKLLHRNLKTDKQTFLKAIAPYRSDLVVSAECIFAWYWVADLCRSEHIPFVLGHALFMKAVHAAKHKNDKIDAEKIARLLRGGNLPIAYVYPKHMRATRDLLRRRTYMVRQRAERSAHIHMTVDQYNLEPLGKRLDKKRNWQGVPEHFPEGPVRMSVMTDLNMIEALDDQINQLENYLKKTVRLDDKKTFYLLQSIEGIGDILAMTLIYEIHDINRFPNVQDFTSYCRLAPAQHISAGKKKGSAGRKMGNAHLKWAFSQAAAIMIRHEKIKSRLEKDISKYGKPGAMRRLTQRLARTTYYMLKKGQLFDQDRFVRA